MSNRGAVRITDLRVAGSDHAVVTIEGDNGLYRREPCERCPWRKDAVGVFPAEAFRHSGMTGAVMGDGKGFMFACHASGAEKPAVCAGYILRARETTSWRKGVALGKFFPDEVSDGGSDLFVNYREMAIANGVSPDDPSISSCASAIDPGIQALFVAPSDLRRWAAHIRPHIEKMAVNSHGRYDTSDLFAALAAGRMLLWIALEDVEIRCVLVGQIMDYPRLKVMRLAGMVGNQPRKWRGLLPLIEDQARRQFGCAVTESLHQPRHLALMPGYRTIHWLSEKPL